MDLEKRYHPDDIKGNKTKNQLSKSGIQVKFSVMVNSSTYGPSTVGFVAVQVEVAPLMSIHKLLQKGCKLTEWSA